MIVRNNLWSTDSDFPRSLVINLMRIDYVWIHDELSLGDIYSLKSFILLNKNIRKTRVKFCH